MASTEGVCGSMVVSGEAFTLDKVCERILSEAARQNYSEDDTFAIHLALEEAFINAVNHGNQGDLSKEIIVDYRVTAEKIEISLIAYECGISYHQVYRLLARGNPTLKTAVLIEKYTEGAVPCEMMLGEDVLNDVDQQIQKKNPE